MLGAGAGPAFLGGLPFLDLVAVAGLGFGGFECCQALAFAESVRHVDVWCGTKLFWVDMRMIVYSIELAGVNRVDSA